MERFKHSINWKLSSTIFDGCVIFIRGRYLVDTYSFSLDFSLTDAVIRSKYFSSVQRDTVYFYPPYPSLYLQYLNVTAQNCLGPSQELHHCRVTCPCWCQLQFVSGHTWQIFFLCPNIFSVWCCRVEARGPTECGSPADCTDWPDPAQRRHQSHLVDGSSISPAVECWMFAHSGVQL